MTTRAIGYARVSTEQQGAEGVSLDVQLAALQAEAERRGWDFYGVSEEASAKTLKRPVLQEALRQLASGAAQVLIVHRLDRLGRSLLDVLQVVDSAKRQGWRIVFTEQAIDTDTSTGVAMLQMLGVFAELDNSMKGERVREAMARLKAQGVQLGNPVRNSEQTVDLIVDLRAQGLTYGQVAEALTQAGVPTARGGAWHGATVRRVLASRGVELSGTRATHKRPQRRLEALAVSS